PARRPRSPLRGRRAARGRPGVRSRSGRSPRRPSPPSGTPRRCLPLGRARGPRRAPTPRPSSPATRGRPARGRRPRGAVRRPPEPPAPLGGRVPGSGPPPRPPAGCGRPRSRSERPGAPGPRTYREGAGRGRRPRSRRLPGGRGPAKGRPSEGDHGRPERERAPPRAFPERRGRERRPPSRRAWCERRAGDARSRSLLLEERHRAGDRYVAGASTEIAAQVREKLLDRCGLAALAKETDQSDHEPRSTVAALERPRPFEGLLNRAADRVVGHPLDGREGRPFDLVGEGETRERRDPVHQDGAGPAVAAAAPLLRALESEAPADGVEQTLRCRDVLERSRPAVDRERERWGGHRPPFGAAAVLRTARSRSVPTRCLRYSSEARRSVVITR